MRKKIVRNSHIELLIIFIIALAFLAIPILQFSNQRAEETYISVLVLLINLILILKNRNNYLLFFVYLAIGYFNYSFIYERYFSNRVIMSVLYAQLGTDQENLFLKGVEIIALFMMILFLCDIFFNKNRHYDLPFELYSEKKSWLSVVLLFLMMLMIPVALYVPDGQKIYEYSVIIIILGMYYSGGEKSAKIIWGVITSLYFIYGNLMGMRVPVLPFVFAYVLIVFSNKLNYRNISVCFLIGITLMTLSGLYGDGDKNLSLDQVIEKLQTYRFSLDTAQFAYLHSIIMIKVASFTTILERLRLFLEFSISQIFGNIFEYSKLQNYTIQFYVHYDGGILPYYFYFYLGWFGVVLIGVLTGWIINYIIKISNSSSKYRKLLSIFIVSMIPKWYLYEPVQLFRGVFLFSLVYGFCEFLKKYKI